MRGLRIFGGLAVASIVSLAVRGAFSGGGGASVKDLKRCDVVGMSVELPGAPRTLDVPMPLSARINFKSIDAVQVNRRNFETGVSRMVLMPGFEANPDKGLDSGIQDLIAKQGLTLVGQDRKPANFSGAKGTRCTAVLRKGSDDLEMHGVVLAKGPTCWMVISLYLKNNVGSREAAARIVDSIQITP